MENVDARDPPRNGGTSTRQCGQGLKLHLISGYPNIIQVEFHHHLYMLIEIFRIVPKMTKLVMSNLRK